MYVYLCHSELALAIQATGIGTELVGIQALCQVYTYWKKNTLNYSELLSSLMFFVPPREMRYAVMHASERKRTNMRKRQRAPAVGAGLVAADVQVLVGEQCTHLCEQAPQERVRGLAHRVHRPHVPVRLPHLSRARLRAAAACFRLLLHLQNRVASGAPEME